MKSAGKWFVIAAGFTAVWYVTRAVVVQFLGILAFFVAAFEASVHQITVATEAPSTPKPAGKPLPKRLATDQALRRNAPDLVIDLREEINAS
jgi:hypothetical protein